MMKLPPLRTAAVLVTVVGVLGTATPAVATAAPQFTTSEMAALQLSHQWHPQMDITLQPSTGDDSATPGQKKPNDSNSANDPNGANDANAPDGADGPANEPVPRDSDGTKRHNADNAAVKKAQRAAKARYPQGYPMVALGDSTLALAPTSRQKVSFNGCRHSENNWPQQVSRVARLPLADLTCAGIKTSGYWNLPLDIFLGPQTRLVVLTYGDNDIRTVPQLIRANASPQLGPFLNGASRQQVTDRLSKILDDVRRRAPQAMIITVGYLPFMKYGPCKAMKNVSYAEWARVHRMRVAADKAIEDASRGRRGVYSIPLRGVSGHDLCTSEAQGSYIINHVKGVRYHYTVKGVRYVAGRVSAMYRTQQIPWKVQRSVPLTRQNR